MYDQIDDKDILAAIQSGDQKAYRELFRRHFKDVCLYAHKVFPDQHKAKDFAQEVFLDLWKRRETISISGTVRGYLTTAAKYKAIDHIRAKKITFEENPTLNMEKITNHNMTEFKELRDVVHQTVDALPQRCKIIFSMSRFEQMSHGEIAKELGISKKTIENQITKALKILRQSVVQYQLD